MTGKSLGGSFIYLVLLCTLAITNAAFAAGTEDKEKAGVSASDAWLKLVDSGGYAESWNTAAEYFKINIKQDQWEQAMKGMREPLGKMINRTVKSTRYATSVPGAPDGEYVVIQYQSTFENKKWTIETITPKLEKDGTWKVSGYYIN
jgi:hypothetical protein